MAAVRPTPNLDRAHIAWDLGGAKTPDWIVALAIECDRSSQGRVARKLGISAAVVNQVLAHAYKGRLDRVETRVRGELMRETVTCPVLGEITKRECLDHQGAKFVATNPMRVRLWKACKSCPNREEAQCSSA
jgi:hypothetical protein